MRRAFSLMELLVVLAIVVLLAALLFPVFAQARRSAQRATCLSNLRQAGVAIGLYQNDANGLLPVGTIHRWQNSDGKGHLFPPGATRDVMEPLQRYAGGAAVLSCPTNGGAFFGRWIVRTGTPSESRLIVPEPSHVLVQCMHHLDKGWRGGPQWEEVQSVEGRRGNHLALRGDLSVGLLDARTLRLLVPETRGGEETWRPAGPGAPSEAVGVFASEAWPPEWRPLPEDVELNWGRGRGDS